MRIEPTDLPELPEELTSFGAAIAGKTLYVYGGHTGEAHSYSVAEQSGRFWSLDLHEPTKWQPLPAGPQLQGLALVAYDGKVIRIGGFTALNEQGEEQNLQSQSDVSLYDPQTATWTEMTPLPESRSSFDAAVLNDHLYVFGGWQLDGEHESVWHQTAWSLDLLRPGASWKRLATSPVKRRAISVAALGDKLFVIGGMHPENGPMTRVDVYDPASDSWSEAPSLIGKGMNGFGSSAFAVDGQLYVSTMNGDVQRLSQSHDPWHVVGQIEPARFFHRMLPHGDAAMLLIGGANMETGKIKQIERIVIE